MHKENTNLIRPTNVLKLRGTIIGIRSSTTLTSFIIITDGNEKKGSTVVNVTFYVPIEQSFKVKDHVDIIAHMQSKLIKTDEKNKFHQLVIGDKIKLTNRLLADYLPLKEMQTQEGGIPDDVNKAFVYGKISRIYLPNNFFAIVTVKVPSAEMKMNYIDIICYKRQAQMVNLLAEDDFIVCIGEIRTAKEKPKSNEIFEQSIVCKDMAKLDSALADLNSYV